MVNVNVGSLKIGSNNVESVVRLARSTPDNVSEVYISRPNSIVGSQKDLALKPEKKKPATVTRAKSRPTLVKKGQEP